MDVSRCKVLLIEDSPGDALLIRQMLARAQGAAFDLEWVDRLAAGLERLDGGGTDVVLLDLGLPDSFGLDTLRRVHERAPSTAILVLTGTENEAIGFEAMQCGAEDYLVKGQVDGGLLVREIRYGIERKRLEAAGRASEERYRRITEAVTDYIFTARVKDGHAVETVHGPGCIAVTGYSSEEFATRPYLWITMVPPEDRAIVVGQAGCILSGGGADPIEHRITRKDGAIRWVRNTPVPHYDAQGNLVSYDGLVSDITQRRRAEEARERAQRDWENTFQSIGQPAMVLDLDRRILAANRALVQATGRPLQQILGERCYRICHGADRPPAQCVFAEALSGNALESREMQFEATGRTYLVSCSPMLDGAGRPEKIIHISWDVTEHKRTAVALGQAVAEFNVARRIQDRLFPSEAPALPGFDIAGMCRPAKTTAGDYFDYIPMLGGCVGLVIGDVSGEGLGPSLLMAQLRSCLRTLAMTLADAGAMLTIANRLLARDVDEDHFVTLVLARLDPQTRSLAYAGAGHPAYLLRRSGEVSVLKSTGCPLCVVEDTVFAPAPPIILEPGEIILLLTDGILEAESPDPDRREFGIDRVLDIVRAERHRTAREILDAIRDAAMGFHGPRPQSDDMAAVVLKVLPGPEPSL